MIIDAQGGASGDMFLAALLGLGLPLNELEEQLKKLDLKDEYRLECIETSQRGFSGQKFRVQIKEKNAWIAPEDKANPGARHKHDHAHQGHKHFAYQMIKEMIQNSELDKLTKERSIKVFDILAKAEAEVHGKKVEDVHFHEVGATDSIIDIVGSCWAIGRLGIEKVYCSAIGIGQGTIKCAHGMLPLPAPATQLILRGIPIFYTGESTEMCTPTGAALLVGLADFNLKLGSFQIRKVGYGLSHRVPKQAPPFLRMSLLENESIGSHERECLMLISTNIDDMNPEYLPHITEMLFDKGALDVYSSHISMKKGRVGVELKVLCHPSLEKEMTDLLLLKTTTFGVRKQFVQRDSLKREFIQVETPWGKVRVKVGTHSSGDLKHHIEYEDIKQISNLHNLAWQTVLSKVQSLIHEK